MRVRTAVLKAGEARPDGTVFTVEALAQLAHENPLNLHFDGQTLWEDRVVEDSGAGSSVGRAED